MTFVGQLSLEDEKSAIKYYILKRMKFELVTFTGQLSFGNEKSAIKYYILQSVNPNRCW
jgi:hypothetical protein